MEKVPTKIIKDEKSAVKLTNTPCLKGQEYCAYTFLLIPNPQTDNYGVIKVVMFGTTMEEVEEEVKKMLDDGRLEKDLPFIRICRTGDYRYLKAGGDDRDAKESYNLETQETVIAAQKLMQDKRKKKVKEMKQREKDLKQEAEDEREADPNSFEVYAYFRTTISTATQRLKQLQGEMDQINKVKGKALRESQRIQREHGNFKLRYEKQFKQTPVGNPDEVVPETKTETVVSTDKGKEEDVPEMKPVSQETDEAITICACTTDDGPCQNKISDTEIGRNHSLCDAHGGNKDVSLNQSMG